MIERRYSGTELRAEGRRLVGPAIRYGDISPSHRERFEPGAFDLDNRTRWLDLEHDPTRVLAYSGAGLDLRDGPEALNVDATLPKLPLADFALEGVREGKLRGFSIEFSAKAERREGEIRVVERAELVGVALVGDPSYQGSRVENRRRSGRTLRAAVPADETVACECAGQDTRWARVIGPAMEQMWKDAFEGGTKAVVGAYLENYATPIASTARGTMRGRIRGIGGYEVDLDIPDSEAGRALLAAWEDSGIIVRPFITDQTAAVVDGVNEITAGRLRAFILTSSDAREGWPAPTIINTPDDIEALAGAAPRRRSRIWL